ncbi:MAG: hypothetical protein D6804_05170, partial [Aquificota bacterium]
LLTLLFLLWYFGYGRHRRELFDFYNSIGAKHTGYRWLIFPVAELEADGKKFRLFTEGGRGLYAFKVSLEVQALGYLRLWRGGLLDRILFRRRYMEGIFVEYEDSQWAEKLLGREDFKDMVKKLFDLPGLSSVEIKGKKLILCWHLGGMDRFRKVVSKEAVLEAFKIMADLGKTIDAVPSAEVYRETLRGWLTLKLPIFATILLSIAGFFLGFYRYDHVCDHEILLAGFKILMPIVILYTASVLFLTGGPTLGQRVILKTFFICLVCIPMISLFFLTWVNGYFDRSEPEFKRDTIARKYHLIRGGHRVVLAELHKSKWCDSFKVSEGFYMRAQVGDRVEYAVKRGFLGVSWLYRKLSLTE